MSSGAQPEAEAVIGRAKDFYDRQFSGERYMAPEPLKWPELEGLMTTFVREFGLAENGKCLEIGCGRCEHQHLVRDYTGVDIADAAARFVAPGKTFRQCSATDLPFAEGTFDGAWTIWTIEHVPDPEKALSEIRRVLKPGGVLFLAPAWQCRPWAANGYPVRPYRDFNLWGKLIKASIPLRNWIVWRSIFVFPRRFVRWLLFTLLPRPTTFWHSTLTPNFERYWMADSDAINKMDPYEAIVWFRSRGDEVLFPPTPLAQFFVRTGHLVVRVRK